ncbi:MAG: hypothetical protein LBT38_04425, partial [Deltaproteobacteria bacterium]|nr:hypothetical protein [Deltaproteobacteria bacterium]
MAALPNKATIIFNKLRRVKILYFFNSFFCLARFKKITYIYGYFIFLKNQMSAMISHRPNCFFSANYIGIGFYGLSSANLSISCHDPVAYFQRALFSWFKDVNFFLASSLEAGLKAIRLSSSR